ncbi:BTAD domain-containing putative transcriptional regulator [Streptomyces sp. NPDC014733]|uniref:AfsR/SARP family transcriptional regulator n=1 Tax=Streptomyces sp. NPDC014733 TaxID=3364885 RepID=UPI0036FCF044
MDGDFGPDGDVRRRIAVLGPVRAWRDGTPLELGPVRRRAVLAALALRPDTRVSHEQLLDDVWGDRPPPSGRRVLPSYVYPLRKALDPPGTPLTHSVIRSDRGGYRLCTAAVRLDTTELAAHTAAAHRAWRAGDPATAADRFGRALALLGDEPLTGLPGPFAHAERQRLARHRSTLLRDRLACLVDLDRCVETLDGLAALCAADPYDEALAALRMRALHGAGRQAAALAVHQEMRTRLRDELGIDPGEELRRVHQAVLRRDDGQLRGPRAPGAAPPVPAPRPRRVVDDLPAGPARLIGRHAAHTLLTEEVPSEGVAVLAVDGVAGVGKTAFVLHTARTLRHRHPDGSLFVDLRTHSAGARPLAPQRALRRLLRAVGASGSEVPEDLDDLTAAWRAATGALRLLLVLDDVRDAAQIRPLLPAGPGSTVLVAGRRRLPGLDADRRVTLEPLDGGDGLALLRDLVGADRADREPAATRQLVRLCDGLPLALRIAGARLQTRPAWTLASLVERMAGDERRLGELRAGDRSVEAAFRLSYDHLAPEQRRGFRVLGLAPTVEFDVLTSAAMLHRPPQETERLLESLVDASLLHQPGPGRYRLHDLVRAHARRLAAESPGESATARTAGLRLYLDAGRLTSDWGPDGFPTGPRPGDAPFTGWQDADGWLDAAGGELADVVTHAVALGETDQACWIAEALSDYFARRGRYHECRGALRTALAHADACGDPRMPGALRNCLGITEVYQGRHEQGRAWFTEVLQRDVVHPDLYEQARALGGLGTVELQAGRPDHALVHLTAALAVARRLGDNWLNAMGLCVLGALHHTRHRHAQALACYTAALTHAEANGRPRMIGKTLASTADVHLDLGHFGEARALYRHAADLAQRSGDVLLHAIVLTRMGSAEHGAGNLPAATALHHQALARHRTLSPLSEPHRDRLEMDIRYRLGRTYSAAGRLAEAREQFRTVLTLPGADAHPGQRALALEALRESGAEGRGELP